MDGIKHSGRFAEMERLVNDYFNCHIAPVMSKTRTDLIRNQGEEMKEYSTSLGGILSMMASSAQPMSDPYQTLKVTGEWNSKTTEDYIEMCKTEITGSKEMQQDLAYMAGQWRDTVVQEIGRARYDELSEQLGCDLAYAYMDHRIEELMIDRLVKERMPKSSADYIVRKAAESSLLGLSQTLSRSPLTDEIEARGEAAYRPNRWEKGTGWMLGTAADTLMMGGAGSWTALAKFAGTDVAIAAIANHFEGKKPDTLSVEQCISKGVFGSDRNVFDDFRKEAAQIQVKENTAIGTDNKQLKKKIPVMDFGFMEWTQNQNNGLLWPNVQNEEQQKHEERYKDVPIVVAPGQEEAYLQSLEQRDKAEMVRTEQDETMKEEKHETVVPANDAEQHVQTIQSAQVTQGNGNGWGGLLDMLIENKLDARNPHYLCPLNVEEAHDWVMGKCKKKYSEKDEKDYIAAKSRFFNLSFADGNIMVRVLESLSDFYKEGKLLHHCVFSNAYYKREDSLIMSATVDGRRMETVEFSLSRMEVCQCRGKSNQLSAYHDRILNLVRDNIPLIRERMVV